MNTNEPTGSLTGLEKTLLLQWFMYRLSLEDRRVLMTELPVAYRHLIGTDR